MRDDRTNPFPGLRSFDVDENELFFGRKKQIDELLLRLRQSRFTAVIGTSGSGKSSLVRAGLLPALKRGLMAAAGSRWRVALFRPINDPIGNLTKALKSESVFADPRERDDLQLSFIDSTLRRSSLGLVELVRQSRMEPGENLLIVVDQFEELFRFEQTFSHENPADEAAAFVKLLLAATAPECSAPIFLVLTMRSDYLGESARFRGLPEAINKGQYLVPRMDDDERREAITAPVAVGNGQINEPLVNRLLNDVGDDPSKLPLLQHALMRTWEHWENDGKADGAPLNISNYEAIGSLSGSLSKHANDIYQQLPAPQKLVAERVFKALTAKGPDGRGLRTPRTFGELCSIAEIGGSSSKATEEHVRAVIEAFRAEGRSFLMPPPRSVENPDQVIPLTQDTLIDISHESLVLGWDRLQQWVESEADSARMYQRLAEQAVLYDRKDERLLMPPSLPVFVKWRDQNQPNREWARRYFNPSWSLLFREEGAKTNKYETEFDRADAFLNESQEAYEVEVEAREKAAKKRIRSLGFTAGAFALLFIVSGVAAAFASVQWNKANSALDLAKEEKRKADEATARAVAAEKIIAEQLQVTQRQKEEVERQREKALQAEKVADAARAEAVKQRDAATQSAEKAILNEKRAMAAQVMAQNALTEAERSQMEAIIQAKNAKASLKKAEEETQKANTASAKALAESKRANEQRLRADIEFSKADKTLMTLRNIDNQTRYLNTIDRHDDSISTAVFARDGKHAFVSSGNDGLLFEMRSGSWEFIASDFRDVPRLVYKLQRESNLSFQMHDLLPSETKELLKKYEDSEKPDEGSEKPEEDSEKLNEAVTASLVSGFNSVLKNPKLYDKSAFRYVKLRQPTQEMLDKFNRDQSSVDVVQLNRLLLEDAYPLEIAQMNQFNQSRDFSRSHYVFAFSPDGKRVAAKYDDQQIDVFDLNGRRLAKKEYDPGIRTVGFSPKGTYVWSVTADDSAVLFWKNNNVNEYEPRELKVNAKINQAVISPDERQIAINTSSSSEIRIWNLDESGESFPLEGTKDLSNADFLKPADFSNLQKSGQVTHIAYSNDGKYIVATFGNHTKVRLWDAITGKLIHVLGRHHCQVNSATFSNNSELLVTAGEDGAAFIWDVKRGKMKHELRGHQGLMISVVRKGLHAWLPPVPFPLDLDLRHREGEYIPLNSAKFNSDGTKVITTSVDGRVVIWTWKDGEAYAMKFLELKGYVGNVLTAEFSPKDEFVIAGGQDGTARIWRLPTPSEKNPEKNLEPRTCKDAAVIRAANTRR